MAAALRAGRRPVRARPRRRRRTSRRSLNASGRAGAGADPDRLRAEGETRDAVATATCAAVTVPGCVDGWVALHERFGRLPLADVLAPARRLAAEGFAASPTLVALVRPDAATGRRAAPTSSRRAAARPGTGRPAARLGARLARDRAATGGDGFYDGPFGEGLLALGDGEFAAADLERPGADWVAPLGLRVWGRQVWTVAAELAGLPDAGRRVDRRAGSSC